MSKVTEELQTFRATIRQKAAGLRDVIEAVLQFLDFGFHFRMNIHHVVFFCFSSGETDCLLIAATHISFKTHPRCCFSCCS